MLEPAGLVRLTTLETRAKRSRRWRVHRLRQPTTDPLRGFVDIASEIPPIEAVEGAEVRLTIQWVAAPPVELEAD